MSGHDMGVEDHGKSSLIGGELSDDDFNFIRRLVYDRFGINLTDQKRSLVVGRLRGVLRQKGLADFHAYRLLLEHQATDAELDELINRISTNHTFFFRESDHFVLFEQTILPEMVQRHAQDRDLRIWCAAASSGEEPYSIVITMRNYFGESYKHWNAGLLATDVSAKVLALAREGLYAEDRLKGVTPEDRRRYFARQPDGRWLVDESLRRDIVYRRFNLMNVSFPFRKPFDVIFCRNVMIYFDQPTRARLVDQFARFVVPGGYLLIGHSESLGRDQGAFEYVKPAVYRKKEMP